ncbi:hypothetical protein [Pedobacter paludis]|uniref:Uncharacterized protein n=1 Tax=Pedobacter paludis TaxID=2203212 RepID=A0A317F3V2_9SPHI|nr:hypothetical protein [Pedobacter paludis]PWS32529.1 hypothetical protein DF947_05465 [Pedobacter paludis]
MFIPLFIAILLGLASPSNTNTNCNHNNGTTVSAYGDEDPGDTPPGGDDTGGEGGHVPPVKPPIKP